MDAVATTSRLAASTTAARGTSSNLVELILHQARRAPCRPALLSADASGHFVVVRYGDLVARVADYGAALRSRGLRPGARVLVLMRPDHEVYALALAILACGMTLALVDGRRGARRLLAALGDAEADAIVGPPSLMRWWPLIPALRRARRFTSLDAILCADSIRHQGETALDLRPNCVDPATPAIVSFSSGNSGRAKAIVRTHGVLLAQHHALAAAFPVDPDDVNLPGFPVATIHNLCCGTATVLPPADLRAMADADPAAVLALIERCGVTSVSGAPAYMARLASAILGGGIPALRIRRIVIGGGPVGRALCADVLRAFPTAEAHVVYGATEAEPIASVPVREVLAATEEEGFLIGRAVEGTQVRLLSEEGEQGLTGEIAVRGAHVGNGESWHRTGDIARIDTSGRLSLLGRIETAVVHRGRVLQPFVAEAAALSVRGIRAAALVAHRGAPDGELVVELGTDADAAGTMEELRGTLARRGLRALRIRLCRAIPMDARHASKVSRGELLDLLAWELR